MIQINFVIWKNVENYFLQLQLLQLQLKDTPWKESYDQPT